MKKILTAPGILLFLLLVSLSLRVSAQNRIENIRVFEPVEKADGQVMMRILYDLISEDPEATFNIELFTSFDSYALPLEKVSGNGFGPNTKPGKDLVIEWYPVREFGTVDQEVIFDIRGRLEVPLVVAQPGSAVTGLAFKRPTAGQKFKPGTSESLQWEGGAEEDNFKLELVRNNVVKKEIGTTINTGNFTWKIPQDVKGKDFQVKLTDVNNPSRSVLSGRFKVGKTSVLVYAIPIAVVGGAAAYFLTREGGLSGPTDPCVENPAAYQCLSTITATPPANPGN